MKRLHPGRDGRTGHDHQECPASLLFQVVYLYPHGLQWSAVLSAPHSLTALLSTWLSFVQASTCWRSSALPWVHVRNVFVEVVEGHSQQDFRSPMLLDQVSHRFLNLYNQAQSLSCQIPLSSSKTQCRPDKSCCGPVKSHCGSAKSRCGPGKSLSGELHPESGKHSVIVLGSLHGVRNRDPMVRRRCELLVVWGQWPNEHGRMLIPWI